MSGFGVVSTTVLGRGAQGRRLLAGAFLGISSGLLLLSGCAAGHDGFAPAAGGAKTGNQTGSQTSGGSGAIAHGKLAGHVKGGNPPVTNATVTLYAAATTAYADPSRQIASTMTDASGNFGFANVQCSADDQLYVVATGGNPGLGGNSSNPNLSMMAALGSCSTVLAGTPSSVNIDEVTTVVSAYALSGFMADAAHVGTSPTNVIGLKNAFATVPNLVDLPSGAALSITPAYAGNSVPNYNTSIVPAARINALANALAACVNSTGGVATDTSTGCGQLFSYTTVGTAVPVDTLQAALSIAQHPGNNASQIAGLVTANPFFQPSLTSIQTAALTDWSLVVIYQGAGLSTANTGTSTPTALALAIDGTGNIWVPGIIKSPAGNMGNGFVAVFNNQGAPLPISPSATASSPGGFSGAGIFRPQAIAIDQNNYAWIGGSTTGNLTVIDSTGTVKGNPTDPALMIPAPSGIAMDQYGNMWVSSNVGNCAGGNPGPNGGNILEFAPAPDFSQELQPGGYDNDGLGDTCPTFLAIDGSSNLWTGDNGNWNVAYDNNYNGVVQISMTDGSPVNPPNYNVIPAAVSIDALGNAWMPAGFDAISTALQYLNGADVGPTAVTVLGDSCNCFLSTTSPFAVDGADHVWTVVDYGYVSGNYLGGLVAYDPAAGEFVSPSRDAGPSSQTNFTGYLGWDVVIGNAWGLDAQGVGVDASGNVWIANGAPGSFGTDVGSQLVEYIGIAAPAAMPLNPSMIGVKP